MSRQIDIILAACAPAIWGSTYIVTTQMLPAGYPLTNAVLRALPAGLVLMLMVRRLPPVGWLGRLLVLGGLNFAVFWAALFVAAYRLPGGVAATLGAVQPMLVLVLAHLALGAPLTRLRVMAAMGGLIGVALLVLGPQAQMDPLGVAAALTGAVSMACGVVLTRKWRPEVSTLTLTAWQLTAGGLLLIPAAWWFEPALPPLDVTNLSGYLWLGLFGAAISYFLWFRGIERLGPSAITGLGFLSPVTAVVLGWAVLGETLGSLQGLGAGIVLLCAWLGTRPVRHVISLHPA
ncbi:EamA family transporter [Paracoccus nototheniae]|uniref:EamA family transporter n=1 Tax=Paracoccus nototheniae TaxID=2489002 RepID=A0ABW4DZW7_9RHOB|nr:EamA family transporter [Paracoccus nototheniae]